MLVVIYDSCIYFTEQNNSCVSDYHNYILDMLKEILSVNLFRVNIVLGNERVSFNNSNKVLRIKINYEHTLVKKNGRDSQNSPFGNTKCDETENYLVRIDNYQFLNDSDIVIDYSLPNIHNVTTSQLFESFSKKMLYISPALYSLNSSVWKKREINVLTTFLDVSQPRRKKLIETMHEDNISHTNINNCFDKEFLQKLYENTKILINIHQTDHHHTLEELRVLPALQCGVIVICENSPLNHLVPYNDYIIWSSYEGMIDKIKDVTENYASYYAEIFEKKKNISLSDLHKQNYATLEKKLFSTI